ncbi:MAG: EAL domain-containing protein [Fervidobacterium sp.]
MSLGSIVISVLSLFYLFDRIIHKISKMMIFLSLMSTLLSLLEFLKHESYLMIYEKIQDCTLLFLPVVLLSFFDEFLSLKLSKKLIRFFYTVSIIYFILALTNKIHNLFWSGTRISQLYKGNLRPTIGVAILFYYIIFIIILVIMYWAVIKARTVSTSTKVKIATVFLIGITLSAISFYSDYNYTLMVFSISLTIFTVELLMVRQSWKINMHNALLSNFETSENTIIVLDKDNHIINLNNSAENILNVDKHQLIGKRYNIIEEIMSHVGDIIELGGKYFYVNLQVIDGTKLLTLKDVTNELTSRKHLEEFMILFDSLFENVPDGVVILKQDGIVINCNSQFSKMFGYSKSEVLGKKIDDLIVPNNLRDEPAKLRELVSSQNTLRVETVRKTKVNKEVDVRITLAKISNLGVGSDDSNEYLIYAFYTDITSEREAMNIVRNTLQRDILTGLYTRNYFLRKLSSISEFSSIDDYHVLIFIDISNFSQINILKGHKFGDELLRAISQRLKSALREGDTVSRPYADEFWILLEKAGKSYQAARDVVQNVVNKILSEILKPYYIDGETIEVRFSVGVHIFSVLDTSEEALRKANLALNRAKNSRDKVAFYSILIDNELQERAVKERALREAFYNGELKVFLQPICNYSGRISGAEALIRWIKEDGTILPPYEFIQIIEENGMIIPVGEEILRQVCEVLEKAQNKLSFIDVNISPIQLRDQKMADRFIEITKAYEIKPSKIVLEITENILIDMSEVVKANIDRLLSYGFELCIDDFGTGYSSLSYLTLLPLRKIKVDRSFVFKLPEDKKSIKLLEAIYNITKAFQLEAIPEGVENEKQLEILSMIGYKLFQGYLFGKPVPIDEFIKRLTQN